MFFDDLYTPFFNTKTTQSHVLENHYISDEHEMIVLVVPGFSKHDIEITENGSYLAVKGKLNEETGEWLGATREFNPTSFKKVWKMRNDRKLKDVTLKNGLLYILFEKTEPEAGRKITIKDHD